MNTVEDWWTSFFSGPFGELQLAGGEEAQAPAEIDEVVRLAELTEGSRILDAPFGTGRHSRELARRGHHVTGVDLNPRVIERARALAATLEPRPEFRVEDVRQLHEESAFDLALCHWGSFGYFDEEENAAFLRALGRALRPGGRCFLDTLVAETLYPKFRVRDWQWWGEGERRFRVFQERRFDHDTSRANVTWTFVGNDRPCESRESSIRVYTYRELRDLFAAAGFVAFRAYDQGGAPFALGASRLRLVATKSD